MSETVVPVVPVTRRRIRRWSWRLVLAGALAWAIVAGLPELGSAVAVLRDADRALLAAALACQVAALACLSLCYRAAIASAGARVRLREATGIALRAGAVSRLLPGGGAAAALFAAGRLRRAGVGDGPAFAGVVINGMVTMTALVGLVAVVAGTAHGEVWRGLAGVLLLGLPVVAVRHHAVRRRLEAGLARLRSRSWTTGVATAVDTLARGPVPARPLLTALGCALLAWTCELTGLWLAAAAVAEPLPLSAVALGLGVANAAAAVPHTPGGVGVVELTMTAALATAGIDSGTALGAVLAYRGVGFWFPALLGVGLLTGDRLGRTSAFAVMGEKTT